jgi:prefoldin subunit 5
MQKLTAKQIKKLLQYEDRRRKRIKKFIKKTDKEIEELNQEMGDFDQDQS